MSLHQLKHATVWPKFKRHYELLNYEKIKTLNQKIKLYSNNKIDLNAFTINGSKVDKNSTEDLKDAVMNYFKEHYRIGAELINDVEKEVENLIEHHNSQNLKEKDEYVINELFDYLLVNKSSDKYGKKILPKLNKVTLGGEKDSIHDTYIYPIKKEVVVFIDKDKGLGLFSAIKKFLNLEI